MTILTSRSGTTEQRLEPGEPGRELEQRRRVELPWVQPQQERPRQPQRQPGFSSREHGPVPCPGHAGHHRGKDYGLSHPSHPVSRIAGTKPPAVPPPVSPLQQAHRSGAATLSLEVECSKLEVGRSTATNRQSLPSNSQRNRNIQRSTSNVQHSTFTTTPSCP